MKCGSNEPNLDFDSAITNAMIDLRDTASGSDERRLLILSFCDVQDIESDDTCNIIMINVALYYLFNNIEYSNKQLYRWTRLLFNVCIFLYSHLFTRLMMHNNASATVFSISNFKNTIKKSLCTCDSTPP